MNNNNYEGIRAILVTGLFVCSCAVAQAQNSINETTQFNSSAPRASLEQSLADTESAANTNTGAEDITGYALLVAKLESDFGPFDPRLSEPLLSTGDMLAAHGEYLEALSYIKRALHIMRINQGLYSEPQIAIVERLVEFNVAIEDWEAVDENFRYLEYLYSRLFDQGSLEWDRGIAKVADWHVIAINNNLGKDREDHLREANKLFKLRLAYAEQDENVTQQVIDVLRHNVEYTAYHLRSQDEIIKSTRIYTRLDSTRLASRYREEDRIDSLAFAD